MIEKAKQIIGAISLQTHKKDYKKRRELLLSDNEFEEMEKALSSDVLRLVVLNDLYEKKIKELDEKNKKVQKGKENSLISQIEKEYQAIIANIIDKVMEQ